MLVELARLDEGCCARTLPEVVVERVRAWVVRFGQWVGEWDLSAAAIEALAL